MGLIHLGTWGLENCVPKKMTVVATVILSNQGDK